MTDFDYTLNVPNPPNRPSQDVANMQINTNSIAGIIAQDHIGFGENNGGYHTVIHSIPTNTPTAVYADMLLQAPANIVGVEQVFPLLYKPNTSPASAADTQLFSRTGAGGISQLTGNNAQANGWCWIGGILLQWGVVQANPANVEGTFPDGIRTANTVTFQSAQGIPFPRQIFNVQTTPIYNSTTSGTGGSTPNGTTTVYINNYTVRVPPVASPPLFTITSFNWSVYPDTAQCTGFFWMAIGN